jgi:hypothetical protein
MQGAQTYAKVLLLKDYWHVFVQPIVVCPQVILSQAHRFEFDLLVCDFFQLRCLLEFIWTA